MQAMRRLTDRAVRAISPMMNHLSLPRRLACLAVPAAALLLSGCGSPGGGGIASASAATKARPAIRQPVTRPARDPEFQRIPGLEGVIGASAAQLMAQFGEPRLDVLEGDVRKLQYSGTACVLDIYLYPTSSSREPVATYVDARRSSDGQDVDRVACAKALKP